MTRNTALFIQDVLDSLKNITEYTAEMSADTFNADKKCIDAVIRNLEIIGEASKNISDSIKEKYQGIPWKKIIGFRNLAAHEYFGIDSGIVWQIITRDLPPLKSEFEKIAKENK